MNLRNRRTYGALLLAAGTAILSAGSASAGPVGAAMTQPIAVRVTSYAKMTEELRADAAASPLLTIASIGKSTRGKTLWMARAGEPGISPDKTVRVLFLCRQHGDEPASTEAVLGLLGRLAQGKEPELRAQLTQTTFYFIPMVNPDGADANTRRNGAGADLNRDWGAFAQPETRAVDSAARRLSPQVVVDAHNWDGDDLYNANCIEAARDRSSAVAGAARAAQSDAAMALTQAGFHINATAYGPQADARLAHRYFTSQGVVSMLVETHSGDPGDVGDFVRRQGVYVGLIHALGARFAQPGARADLDALESIDDARAAKVAGADQDLFAARKPAAVMAHRSGKSARRTPRWLPSILAFALALWAMFGGRASIDAQPAARRYRFCRKSWLRNIPGSRVGRIHAIRPAGSRVAIRPGASQDAIRPTPRPRRKPFSAHPSVKPGAEDRRCDSSTPPRPAFVRASAAPSAARRGTLPCPR